MERITAEEITDHDGQVRIIRKIEAAGARIEHADGTVEEYSGTTAEESRRSPDGRPPEWYLFGVPMLKLSEQGLRLNDMTVSLLSENGETILKIGSIMMGMQMSATGRDCLAGSKMPRPLRHDGKRWLCDTQLRG